MSKSLIRILCLIALAFSTGCGAAPSLQYTISPSTAAQHPKLVEYALDACDGWMLAGYPGHLSVVVSDVPKGPQIRVVAEKPICAGKVALGCTRYNSLLETTEIEIWSGVLDRMTVVGHEMGHTLKLPHSDDDAAVMHPQSYNKHQNESDRRLILAKWYDPKSN